MGPVGEGAAVMGALLDAEDRPVHGGAGKDHREPPGGSLNTGLGRFAEVELHSCAS